MNRQIRKVLAAPVILTAAISLSACAGSAPAPCADSGLPMEPPADAADSTSSAAPEKQTAASENASSKDSESKTAGVSSKVDSTPGVPVAEKNVEQTTSQAPAPTGDSAALAAGESSKQAPPPDPYIAFPALANEIIAYADTLFKQGLADSASAYLQRFRIIKPLWNEWQTRTDSLLNEIGKSNAEQAKQFEPLVREIENMNRVQSSYSLVAESVDSLIAMTPGDSLTAWANSQKKIAHDNTLKKAQKEKSEIIQLAENKGQFADAMKKAEEFQMRYRDFEEELEIAKLIARLDMLSNTVDTEAQKYWEKNDPAAALAKAEELISKEKFTEARELLNKLKSSNLRKEAIEKYQKLADAFCNAERKTTSQLFAKAQKQKDAAKKKQLLKDAIAPLTRCIQEYPEYNNMQKVIENKVFLEKEIDR